MNWRVVRLDETDSTNAELARRARAGADEGLVLVAGRQTAGRGRQGRAWFSAPGQCLCLSVLLRPRVAPAEAATLPLVVGAAVAEALSPFLAPRGVAVKWPNDILADDGRKLCGILCEMGAGADGAADHVVAGIGLNVNLDPHDFPPDIVDRATSMKVVAGRDFDPDCVLDALLASLALRYGRWRAGGLDAVRGELEARDALRGRRVEMRLLGEPLAGVCEGIADSGALRLRLDGGAIREVFSGEAHLLP